MPVQYQNPVYPSEIADPFVLRTEKGYFAYGTGPSGSRIFPLLKSPDLVNWTRVGGALVPLKDPSAIAYWAPEVAQHEGRYYLFYSAAISTSDESHQLRVAVSSEPEGPFIDSGRPLLPDAGFTIDGSPFRDPATGQWYLFFATDYEIDEPHGTGLAVVTLSDDLLTATSNSRPILRAYHDAQVYERERIYKGKLWPTWYCLEGPHCLFHEGKYFLFFSGGTWRGTEYGVSYAEADHPLGKWRVISSQHPTVLKALKGTADGPGHSCCVLGPDNRTTFMVYHAWDSSHMYRRMCMDPIVWRHGVPVVDGPSSELRNI